ncbi:uncharacterized protein B0H64DRAFT_232004 [Chaetomium fimeti]|uniref:Altered inheritance of mitochondria protein 21 n=1 Tax=Chaetomium fimeti TaxID=1854472 RepID=A0AAE0H9R6_9PEZI|nr:hypothetical protein B0H64DRAFT_232004 [Chaetomium fimeti]
MPATTKPPVIPPRPSKAQDQTLTPMIPPRPTNRRLRSVSPNPDRFAPSPLNEPGFLSKSPKPSNLGPLGTHDDEPIHRPNSVELPSVGEEGKEYAAIADETRSSEDTSADPEQTRTVAEDLKLHAPKPSLPASSAKQRVQAVTRTDSERAASFGIGRASSAEDSTPALPSNRSLKKKASTASQLSGTERDIDDEQGIPEIGQQVPMYRNAGDVQAPSPAPSTSEGSKGRHVRKTSAHGNPPPGSYGLHGHGAAPQDKLEKAYYEKHPDLLKKEHMPHHYDRPNDYSMSQNDLNKIVKETASRGSGGVSTKNHTGTPSEQVGWQALEESVSRIASPEPKSTSIYIDEPRRRSVMAGETESLTADEVDHPYTAPILADDDVAKNPAESPASGLESPSTRPTSRPTSLYKETSFELQHTPLEDVKEYEPLFEDDENQDAKKPTTTDNHRTTQPHRFPSADVWEDAPGSVLQTAEVSTPEFADGEEKPTRNAVPPPREGETPVQAFARYQEELAEKESHGKRATQKAPWPQNQKHPAPEKSAARPAMQQRFPSRDVWEDAPESLRLETTVSTPQQDEAPSPSPVDVQKPNVPGRPEPKVKSPDAPSPAEKPAIPSRPKPRQPSADDKPAVPGRPKPQIPARPAKASPTPGGPEPAEGAAPPRQKPAVPARPMGSKIAALQAGFMSDLNKRLKLGPQAPPSKQEASPEDEGQAPAPKEKVPLTDARKGRARGPQRRAPATKAAAVASPEVKAEEKSQVASAVVSAVTFFEIDPDEGVLSAGVVDKARPEAEFKPEPEVAAGEVKIEEPKAEESKVEEPKTEETKTEETPVKETTDVVTPGAITAAAPREKEGKEDEQGTVESEKEEVSEPKTTPESEAEEKPEPAAAKSDPEPKPEPEVKTKAVPESGSDAQPEPEGQETKSLATNMAGETLIKEEIKKDEGHQEVEPVKVEEN